MPNLRYYLIRQCIIFQIINWTLAIDQCGKFKFMSATDDLGLERIGSPEVLTSAAKCGTTCVAKYRSCYSFIYNNVTGMCTPGSFLTLTGLKPMSSSETIFSLGHLCDTPKGFRVYNYTDIAICLYISPRKHHNDDAFYGCRDLGGQLISLQSRDKWEILRSVVPGDTRIGLNGHTRRGEYVWTDSSTLTQEQSQLYFGRSNAKPLHDCVTIRKGDGRFTSIVCNALVYFACQKKDPYPIA